MNPDFEEVEIILTVKLTVKKDPKLTDAEIVSELDYNFRYLDNSKAVITDTDIQDFVNVSEL